MIRATRLRRDRPRRHRRLRRDRLQMVVVANRLRRGLR